MKKIFTLLVLSLLLVSCFKENYIVEPIEKYRGKGIIVLETPTTLYKYPIILVKNKDSVFNIQLAYFDAQGLKAGDTIK